MLFCFGSDRQCLLVLQLCCALGIVLTWLAGPGSHSCGNKKGKREKFPKRKEEKREKRISLHLLHSTVTLSYDKKIQKIPRK